MLMRDRVSGPTQVFHRWALHWHPLAQALEWTQLFVAEPRIGPVGAGPSAYPGRVVVPKH